MIVKPDNGVGATSTYKLSNDDELDYFFATKDSHIHLLLKKWYQDMLKHLMVLLIKIKTS